MSKNNFALTTTLTVIKPNILYILQVSKVFLIDFSLLSDITINPMLMNSVC